MEIQIICRTEKVSRLFGIQYVQFEANGNAYWTIDVNDMLCDELGEQNQGFTDGVR